MFFHDFVRWSKPFFKTLYGGLKMCFHDFFRCSKYFFMTLLGVLNIFSCQVILNVFFSWLSHVVSNGVFFMTVRWYQMGFFHDFVRWSQMFFRDFVRWSQMFFHDFVRWSQLVFYDFVRWSQLFFFMTLSGGINDILTGRCPSKDVILSDA